MVKVMMLTQNESMNGFGYPFSLSKSSIPLSGRIFSIIRCYEVLGDEILDSSQIKKFKGTSRNFFTYEYFDSSIYRVFIDCLQDGSIRKIPTKPRSATKVTKYRKKIYREYVAQFNKLHQIKSEIREKLNRARQERATTDDKNTLLREVNELKTFLLKEADMRKVIIITRHGETESDIISGKPGLDTEELTENGENSSSKKGEILGGLELKVFSSPLVRALQTSDIICKKVKDHVAELIAMDFSEYQEFISYSRVIKEPSLANPVKSIENDRYDSLLQKFMTDNNTKEIREFLKNMIFGMEETMNVCITHRDTARHMIIWLNNMFSKNSISGSKVTIGNDTIYEICLRGGSIVKAFSPSTPGGGVEDGTFQIDTSSLKKDSGDGYIFSIANWQSLLKSLNTISEEVFSRPFFSNESELINLIDLTDELLDFIDFESENNPEKFALFVKAVASNSELQEVSTYLQNRSNFVK